MKRKHRNSTRLTARERAEACVLAWSTRVEFHRPLRDFVERALQAHVRQALARKAARRDRWYATGKGAP